MDLNQPSRSTSTNRSSHVWYNYWQMNSPTHHYGWHAFHSQLVQRPAPIIAQSQPRHARNWSQMGAWLTAGCLLASVLWSNADRFFRSFPLQYASAHIDDNPAGISESNRQAKANKLTAIESRKPHLGFYNSIGVRNQPLQLGIILNNGFGGEILVLNGLPAGAKLSAGTDLGDTRWSVLARDLDYAFIAAPDNFSGNAKMTAKLYSSENTILETRKVCFEWTDGPGKNQFGTAGLAGGAQGIWSDC